MTRRAINSEMWHDEFFGELSILEKLVWVGLFSTDKTDNQGRMLDNPNLICSALFPYGGVTPQEIEQCLVNFNGHILRYEVDGKKYIQILNWWEHQPMQYAVPSNYPAPSGWTDRIRTHYKGVKLICNWGDTPDTKEGILLMDKLKSLGRISSWTDLVGTLNPNPNNNPNNNNKGSSSNNPKKEEPPQRPNIYKIYESEIGVISPFIKDELVEIENHYPDGWFIMAVKEAKSSTTRVSLNYIKKILDRWEKEGLPNSIKKELPKNGKPTEYKEIWKDGQLYFQPMDEVVNES